MNKNTQTLITIVIGVLLLFVVLIGLKAKSDDSATAAVRYDAHETSEYGHRYSRSHDEEHALPTDDNCVSDDCLYVDDLEYPAGELPQEVVDALNAAIDDEYKAWTVYDSVLDNIGTVRPFSMIIRAEEQHISALKSLYDKYGIAIPSNPYGTLDVADNKADNCAIGVQAEIDNAALYRDQLLPVVEDYSDITSVFTKLMDASQYKHLPAFERCAP